MNESNEFGKSYMRGIRGVEALHEILETMQKDATEKGVDAAIKTANKKLTVWCDSQPEDVYWHVDRPVEFCNPITSYSGEQKTNTIHMCLRGGPPTGESEIRNWDKLSVGKFVDIFLKMLYDLKK